VEILRFLATFSWVLIDAVGIYPIGAANSFDLSYIGGNATPIDSREKEYES
jgi:hypothetical protein